jgi:acyl carrier protein
MSANRIEDQLKALIIAQLFLKAKPEDIKDTDDLLKKWEIDSVKIMQLVVGLEEVFGITLEDTEFTKENFRTVKNIAEVVRAKKPDA